MHIAWLYLFQAQYQRDGRKYFYKLPNGRYQRVEGEPKTWEISRFVEAELAQDNPVRSNLTLTIRLRNKGRAPFRRVNYCRHGRLRSGTPSKL
jgi:hypothetical protein